MKKGIILFLTFNLLFLTGCWNYHEIEYYAIASTLAVDKDSNGDYRLLSEFLELTPSQSGANYKTNLVETSGKTIFEAARNMIALTERRPYWSHAKVIIVSEEVARDGIVPILDWVVRDPFPRPTIYLYISKNSTAKEILEGENISTKSISFEYEEAISSFKYLSKSPQIEAYRIANKISEEKLYVVLPTVELLPEKDKLNLNISGSAFFRGDKLEGFLNPMDTMKYLFIINEISAGLIVVNLDEGNKDNATLTIKKSKTKIDSEIDNDEITIILNIKTHVSLAEIDNEIDYTSKEGRQFLKERTEKYIEEELKTLIEKMQKQYGLDIFQFGDHIRKNNPSLWKKIEKDWDSIFRDLHVVINSTVFIEGSGHITKPIKAGD